MQYQHPKSSYGVKALPNEHGPGFVALYWAPGLKAGLRRDEAGRPAVFSREADAEAAAAQRLFEVLNIPRARANASSSKKERYERLSGAEFAELIREVGITPTFLAYLYGTSDKRVFQWVDGVNEKGLEESPPHPVRVLLELFKGNPANIDIAERVTNAVTTSRATPADQKQGL
jgi:DNA-binding transcriptional regulator YiaG